MSTVTTTINHGITFGATYLSPLTITGSGAVKNNGTGKAVFGGTATVVNYGRIIATGNSGGYGYQGIYLGNGYVNNHGSITAAGNAVVFQGTGSVVNSGVIYGGRWGVTSRDLFTITNTGTISGGSEGIVLSGGGFIDNSNLISGADGIGIGGAPGTVDNSGTISSYGAGVALNSGGTVSNAGIGLISVSGQYAAIYITGGAGSVTNAGTLSGYTGVSFVGAYNNTLIDSGTIIGSSGTAVAFDAGNDLLQFQPSNSIDIQGAVYGGGGTNTLEFASGATAGTLTGAGLSFDNFATGTVDVGANWTLAGSVTLGTGLTLTDSGTLVDRGTLVNAGSMTVANYRALQLAPGGSLTNLSSGVIARDATGNSAFSPAIFGQAGSAATIANFGTILNLNGNAGVYLQSGGSIANSGSTALIEANGNAIYIHGGSGTVTNTGTIEGTPSLGGDGIVLAAGGTITNGVSGATGGLISGAGFGVFVTSGIGTVTNFGTIIGTSGYGVYLGGGGTVIDAGTIAGAGVAPAIVFGGSGGSNNLVVLERGFSISGGIYASGTANRLELLGSGAGAAVTASYNGLLLHNFATVAFAPGAGNYATLQITNNATLPGTIAGFIGSHDTVDLTALSDVGDDATTSLNTLTNVLTVTGDNGSVQLQLDSENYSGIGWLASNDGGGGTDITAQGVVAPVISGTVSGQTVNDDATDQPFGSVTITDANSATTSETLTITLTNGGTATDADGTLSGTGLSKTGTGTYTLTAVGVAAATAALDALIFTPTAHQVAPGNTVTTGFTLAVTDGLSAQATNTSTSVIATAVGGTTPSITGTKANQGVANETPSAPFATVTEIDPNVGATPTVTVSLSAPGNGTLSNLSGGSYNASTGVYQVTGSAAADTAALEALVFTPVAQPNVDVTTTTFTISPGAGGTADQTTSVTSVQQILSLAGVPANQVVISVSPDGTGFSGAVAGKTNEAVVSAPVEGGTYTMPTGYQALFLGGTNDATLNDGSVGNAILVANSGNDQLFANAVNDVLVAGSGNDSVFGGSFANTVVGGAGAATVFAGSGAMRVIDGSGPLLFVGGAGAATVTGGSGAETMTAGTGGLMYVAAGSGQATVSSGTGSVTLFGASGASLNLTGTSGNPDYLVAGDGNETLNASGSSSSNWLSVNTSVASGAAVAMFGGSGNDTLIGGAAAGSTMMTGGGGDNAFVFFKQAAGGARDIITDFNTNDAVFIEGYGPGSAAALQSAAFVGAGGLTLTLSDNTTITFGNLTSVQSLDGKIQYG